MRGRLFLSLTLAAVTCAQAPRAAGQESPAPAQAGSAQAAAWSRYTFPGEEFSAELPGMPSTFRSLRQVNNDWRKKVEGMRVFSHYADGVIFFVVSYDKPHESESLDFFATHLRGAWGLTPKGPASAGGFEGRSYNVVGTQRGSIAYDLHGEGRVFRAKRHAYLALALAAERGRPEVERFLNAFALGASPAGESIAEEGPVPRYAPSERQAGTPTGAGTGQGQGVGDENLKPAQRDGAAPSRAPDGPHSTRDVGQKAVIIYKPEPPYTEAARRNSVRGVVRLRVVLSSTGRATNPEVIKSLPDGLTESAIRVSRQMRFFPARKDGRPVSQYVVLEYNFNIY